MKVTIDGVALEGVTKFEFRPTVPAPALEAIEITGLVDAGIDLEQLRAEQFAGALIDGTLMRYELAPGEIVHGYAVGRVDPLTGRMVVRTIEHGDQVFQVHRTRGRRMRDRWAATSQCPRAQEIRAGAGFRPARPLF